MKPATRRRVAALALGVIAGVALLEVALFALARFGEAPLLFIDGAPVENLQRFRLPPDTPYLGHRTNAGGYADDAFFVGAPDRPVIALVADSFGAGIVPRPQGFAAVAERRLADALGADAKPVAIHAFGVPAIGVPEYEWLMATEVPAVAPRAAVVALFPGNDLPSTLPPRRRWTVPGDWRLATVIRRVARWSAEWWRGTPIARGPAPPAAAPEAASPPTMSPDAYAAVVASQWRALDPDARDASAWREALVAALERMRARADFPVLVLLIPTEPQVSPAVRAETVAGRPALADIDVDATHRAVAEALRARGFAVLDLLPPLRAAEAGGRTYHPRDSHWNAHGNAVAGRALADFLAAQVFAAPAAPAASAPRPQ